MTGDPNQPAHPLAAVLDEVHRALTGADYQALGPLTARIEADLARLEADGDPAGLWQVQARALRNTRCLQAAQRGFRAAHRRVEEIKAARSGLVTYGPNGRRAAPHPTGDLAKRF